MATWGEFQRSKPILAERGRQILYNFGVPLGYLATVRKDGGPRLHPFCPILCDGGLYGLIGPSPKQRDLIRAGRYAIRSFPRFALHSFPALDTDDEFYLTGRAILRDDPSLQQAVRAVYLATGGGSDGSERLFEFTIERVLLSTYKKRGEQDNWPPIYEKWHGSAR